MVPTPNSADLASRIPNAALVIYDDAGHGGIFQYHAEFVPEALAFLSNGNESPVPHPAPQPGGITQPETRRP